MPYTPEDLDNILDGGLSRNRPDLIITNKQSNMREHLKSFGITFIVAFAIVLVAQIDSLGLETIKDGTIWGIIFAAVRAGVKGVLELIISTFSKK